jgi:hypothetical protein
MPLPPPGAGSKAPRGARPEESMRVAVRAAIERVVEEELTSAPGPTRRPPARPHRIPVRHQDAPGDDADLAQAADTRGPLRAALRADGRRARSLRGGESAEAWATVGEDLAARGVRARRCASSTAAKDCGRRTPLSAFTSRLAGWPLNGHRQIVTSKAFCQGHSAAGAIRRGSATSRRRMCTKAGAMQFSDDRRPNNAGREPNGFATIGSA